MFKSILFLNGTLADLAEISDHKDLILIAADGGALSKALAKGLSPNLVIGDGDTPSTHPSRDKIRFIIDHDQESTDFEKCLNYIFANNLEPSLVCGLGGGEIDHQHNNLHTFAKFAKRQRMIFLDVQPGYKPKIGFAVYGALELESTVGATLSLLPFPSATVTSEGLEWPLKHERLALLERSGARNRSSQTRVCLQISDGGPLLVVMNAEDAKSMQIDTWELRDLGICLKTNS